jgi:hypothetical protein
MIGQTFPDIVVLRPQRYRLVTTSAMSWVHCNRGVTGFYYEADAPGAARIVHLPSWCAQTMEEDGLVVRKDRKRENKLPC